MTVLFIELARQCVRQPRCSAVRVTCLVLSCRTSNELGKVEIGAVQSIAVDEQSLDAVTRVETPSIRHEDKISSDLFAEQERQLTFGIEAVRAEVNSNEADERVLDELGQRFEEIAEFLANLDVERIWTNATASERRTLVEELLEGVDIYPDHLVVRISGVPPLNVDLSEVGLGKRQSNFVGVGGGTPLPATQPVPMVLVSHGSSLFLCWRHATAQLCRPGVVQGSIETDWLSAGSGPPLSDHSACAFSLITGGPGQISWASFAK